ncbi:class I SAM-dependent methyltransferase [Sorangium sp. So ce315]|uniref:O-methyltransferase n=1 Tax=Sorangium sp. So ce315 TaxID=3133299 RepID=UPI003F5FB08D
MTAIVHPEIDRYAHDHTEPPTALLDELREYTHGHVPSPGMQVGRVEGTLLGMLVALMQARRVLEIGTFTGYSALSMAQALPPDGELVTCERDPDVARVARSFFDRSGHGQKIRIALGDALDTIRGLPASPPFDLVFIDADKARYPAYYEEALPRLRRGGLIVADNTLWSGEVLAPESEDGRALADFNERLVRDQRVEKVLLPVRDGVTLARKR